ncbi:protein YhjJ, putative peptidase [Klebsiella pneumoniae]|nr:protein YhjJ, putative peptidase [Klebsiella pneumoniae]
MKEALSWLADASGKLAITPESINHALQGSDMVATWPLDTKEGWWRYRLKGSTMLGHDPAAPLKQPIDVAQLKDFYQKWYTPRRHDADRGGECRQPQRCRANQ